MRSNSAQTMRQCRARECTKPFSVCLLTLEGLALGHSQQLAVLVSLCQAGVTLWGFQPLMGPTFSFTPGHCTGWIRQALLVSTDQRTSGTENSYDGKQPISTNSTRRKRCSAPLSPLQGRGRRSNNVAESLPRPYCRYSIASHVTKIECIQERITKHEVYHLQITVILL